MKYSIGLELFNGKDYMSIYFAFQILETFAPIYKKQINLYLLNEKNHPELEKIIKRAESLMFKIEDHDKHLCKEEKNFTFRVNKELKDCIFDIDNAKTLNYDTENMIYSIFNQNNQ